jgi:hypothetical protein
VSAAIAADISDSGQVWKLPSEAKTMALQPKEDAAMMEGFTWVDLS